MSVATRIRLVAMGLVLTTAVGVGLVMIWGYSALIANRQREGLDARALIESQRLARTISNLASNTRLLISVPHIDRLFTQRDQEPQVEQMAANLLHDMLLTHDRYVQARLIGVADNGREVIRFDRIGDRIVRTAEQDLQQKGTRDYFQQCMQQPTGVVTFSDVTLNRERGEIEVPHRPMLRAMVPIHDPDGRAVGIAVINMHFHPFPVGTPQHDNGLYAYYLTNQRGDFLLHPDRSKCFGFDLGHRYLAQDEFPQTAGLFDSDQRAINDGTLCFVKMFVFPGQTSRYLVLGLRCKSAAVDAATASIASWASLYTIGLLLIALLASFVLAKRLAQPLAQLTDTADHIARDEAYPPLPVHRRDEIGRLSRAFVHMVDSLRQNEANLTQTNEKLELAVNDLEHFVQLASHDLREPARRVAGFADLLLHRYGRNIEPDIIQMLQRIRGASNRLLQQITDLRAFTQVSSNTIVRKPVAITDIVRSALELYKPRIEQRCVRVHLQELPTLTVYEPLVRLLYENLIANALDYAADDGFELTFTAQQEQGRWILGVHNTGSHMQLPYRQASSDATPGMRRQADHMGLGLAICRHIVERHVGKLRIESGPDDVHVTFDFGKEPTDEDHRNKPATASGHGR